MALTFKNIFCTALQNTSFGIVESDLNQVTSIIDNCFAQGINYQEIRWIHIPGNVRSIGKSAFKGCSIGGKYAFGLETLLFSEGLLWIRDSAFAGINSAEYGGAHLGVSFPSTLQEIGKNAFNNTTLKSLVFDANGNVTIKSGAFEGSLTDNMGTLDLTGVASVEESTFSPGHLYKSSSDPYVDVYQTCKDTKLIIGSTLQELPENFFTAQWQSSSSSEKIPPPFSVVDTSTMNPMIKGGGALQNSGWYKNIATPTTGATYVTGANGKFLVGVKCGSEETIETLYVPSGIINMGTDSMRNIGTTDVQNTVKKVVIPDTVIWMQKNSTPAISTALMAVDVGSSVSRISGVIFGWGFNQAFPAGSYLVFRQPRNMDITIDSHLVSTKDAAQLDIYTDNLVIRNYDWAGDNVTPIFHPLSEAPSR